MDQDLPGSDLPQYAMVWIQLWLPYACGTRFLPDVGMSRKRLATVSPVRRFQDYYMTSQIHPHFRNQEYNKQSDLQSQESTSQTGTLYICEAGVQRKVYICLFTYATTWAVHLEVFTNLSVQTFLLAYRTFAARKSAPQQMISDNASPYLTAGEELTELFKSQSLKDSLSKQGLNWPFIP